MTIEHEAIYVKNLIRIKEFFVNYFGTKSIIIKNKL